MPDQAQEIKEKLNVVDVISGYLRLQKAGVNFKGSCPFHNEKTPSFMVSPSRQSWHCFGCGEGGDIFTFIEKIEGVEFFDALKILAEKAGIILKYENPKSRSEKDRIYEICEKAAQFFTASLNNTKVVSEYIRQRGLKDEAVSEWRLGYAPDSWNSLMSFLSQQGYREPEMEKAGLVLKGQRYHDRFRNRLMFPIFDVNGKAVAFSGRIMNDVIPSKTEKDDSGKYINSPETILFSKSRILYGLDKAKAEIRKADKVVLVEGQMDVILPWQDGVKNIVATSGTALTEDHLLILKRLTGNLTLAFDMDEAGARATERGDLAAVQSGFNVSVINLPSGKDPADFVKECPGEFVNHVNAAEPIMSYYFKRIFKKFPSDGENVIPLEGRKFIAIDLLSKIKRLSSAAERNNWIRELSLKIGVPEKDLSEEMEQLETAPDEITQYAQSPAEANVRIRTRKEILSERLLALLLKKPESIVEAVKAAAFMPKSDFEVLGALAANRKNFSETKEALSADLRSRLDFLHLAGDYELEKAGNDFDVGKEIMYLIKEIEREHYKEVLQKIGQEIKRCEIRLNDVRLSEAVGHDLNKLTEEFKNISKKLYELNEYEKEKNKKN